MRFARQYLLEQSVIKIKQRPDSAAQNVAKKYVECDEEKLVLLFQADLERVLRKTDHPRICRRLKEKALFHCQLHMNINCEQKNGIKSIIRLMMIDLELPGSLKLLSETISKDIDAHCVAKYSEGPRSHLGASQIGKPCSRSLWYNFRWVYYKIFTGQQYRLFQRGHFEEPRFTGYLEGIGCEVKALDKILLWHPESSSYFYGTEEDIVGLVEVVEGIPAHEEEARIHGVYLDKGKRQIRIYGCQGHFAGSLDAVIKLPVRYNIKQDVLFLGEYKTQGTQKFAALVEKGCQLNKYVHYCQQCVYGYKLGLNYGIYIVVDKNTDYLHIEVIKLDHFLGKELEDKAERIIFSQTPPNKISATANFYECNYCDYKEVCWFDKPAEKNCRSCIKCVPIEDAQWFCNLYGANIPKEFIKSGCDEWVSII